MTTFSCGESMAGIVNTAIPTGNAACDPEHPRHRTASELPVIAEAIQHCNALGGASSRALPGNGTAPIVHKIR
jgi:hypothetical protein